MPPCRPTVCADVVFLVRVFSGYGDPNVMASEPGASLVLNAGSANGTSSGRWSVFWTNQAALSITLVVGTFFLVINLLLFAAIYRRNVCRRRDRSGLDAAASADKQVTIPRLYLALSVGAECRTSIDPAGNVKTSAAPVARRHVRALFRCRRRNKSPGAKRAKEQHPLFVYLVALVVVVVVPRLSGALLFCCCSARVIARAEKPRRRWIGRRHRDRIAALLRSSASLFASQFRGAICPLVSPCTSRPTASRRALRPAFRRSGKTRNFPRVKLSAGSFLGAPARRGAPNDRIRGVLEFGAARRTCTGPRGTAGCVRPATNLPATRRRAV